MELGVVGKGNQDDVFEHWEHQDVWQGEVSAAESDARQQAVCPAPAHEAGYAEIASTVEAEDEIEAEPTEVWVWPGELLSQLRRRLSSSSWVSFLC